MYIEPNTTIELMKDLKLESDYTNTMWFNTIADQNTFFADKVSTVVISGTTTELSFTHTYQRKDIGVIRVGMSVKYLYDVTYMRFKNTNFENKWFYAFVTAVEYVNNETCNLYYKLDLIQTYMFDWELHQCLVVRNHSTTDVAGDNLEPESLNLGTAIANGAYTLQNFGVDTTGYSAIIVRSPVYEDVTVGTYTLYADDLQDGKGYGFTSGLPADVRFSVYDDIYGEVGYRAFNNAIYTYSACSHTSDIICILIVPYALIVGKTTQGTHYKYLTSTFTNSTPSPILYSVSKATSLDGYTPTNKKLLTYPYSFLTVSNDKNESFDMYYELFSGNACSFSMYPILNQSSELVLVANYDSNTNNMKYALSCGGFSQMAYSTDGYKAWYAMNYDNVELGRDIANTQLELQTKGTAIAKDENMANLLTGLASSFAKSTVNPAGAVVGAISSGVNAGINNAKINLAQQGNEYNNMYANQSADLQESIAKRLPNTPHSASTNTNQAIKKKGFYFQPMSIRSQFAEKIDKFFTMFGYAQNKVQVPNIHTRTKFTYIKTANCSLSGNIPADDREAIAQIFNNGIRFWTDYQNFGDFTVLNPIITP